MRKFVKELLNKRTNNEKGLTLIELLAVIVILGIIAAIAVPAIGNIVNDSRDKAIVSDALNIIAGAKLAHIETKCGTAGCDATALAGYIDGSVPSTVVVTLAGAEWQIKGYDFTDIATSDANWATVKATSATTTDPVTETALKGLID